MMNISSVNLPDEVLAQAGDALGVATSALSLQSQGGGAHGVRRLIVSIDGRRRALLKCGGDAHAINSEALGLRSLAAVTPDAVVPVLAANDDPPFLLVRWLFQASPSREQMHHFGAALAALHQRSLESVANPGRWGFDLDNWLGGTLQRNRWEGDAASFIARHRIGQQHELLADRGAEAGFLDRLDRLVDRLPHLLDTDSPPCLIHGDLWSGNVLLDPDGPEGGVARMIDPAPWWGLREAELGMTRLFGGLPHHEAFWRGYTETYALEPGSEQRIVLFELYHLLNHWTLFGSGYRASCEERLERLGL